jgi:Nuclear pore assembly and biogenesis
MASLDAQSYFKHLSYLSTVNNAAMRARTFFMAAVDEVSKTSPSLTSLVLLLIILFLSLRILGMLYRAVVFWLTIAVKIALGFGIVFLSVWIYTRGPEGFINDLQDIASHWTSEYNRYSRHAGVAQQFGADVHSWLNQNKRKSRKRGW